MEPNRVTGFSTIGRPAECESEYLLTPEQLRKDNNQFADTTGVSKNCRPLGFRPAFHDTHTGSTYLSRFSNGQPAPFHLLEGLPDTLVAARSSTGTATAVKATVVAGFLRDGCFYTREQAAFSQSRN